MGVPCGSLNRLRISGGVGKILSGFVNEGRQLVQIGVGWLVHCGKSLHERKRCGAAVRDVPILSRPGAFGKQIVCKVRFLPRGGLYHAESGAGQRLQGFVAVIVHIDLPVHSSKSEMVGDHKSVHGVVLRQAWIGFLEFADLFRIEHMDFPLKTSETPVLTERVDQRIPVDRGASMPIVTLDKFRSVSTDTIFSVSSLAPPRLFRTEKLLCLLPPGIIR